MILREKFDDESHWLTEVQVGESQKKRILPRGCPSGKKSEAKKSHINWAESYPILGEGEGGLVGNLK